MEDISVPLHWTNAFPRLLIGNNAILRQDLGKTLRLYSASEAYGR